MIFKWNEACIATSIPFWDLKQFFSRWCRMHAIKYFWEALKVEIQCRIMTTFVKDFSCLVGTIKNILLLLLHLKRLCATLWWWWCNLNMKEFLKVGLSEWGIGLGLNWSSFNVLIINSLRIFFEFHEEPFHIVVFLLMSRNPFPVRVIIMKEFCLLRKDTFDSIPSFLKMIV